MSQNSNRRLVRGAHIIGNCTFEVNQKQPKRGTTLSRKLPPPSKQYQRLTTRSPAATVEDKSDHRAAILRITARASSGVRQRRRRSTLPRTSDLRPAP